MPDPSLTVSIACEPLQLMWDDGWRERGEVEVEERKRGGLWSKYSKTRAVERKGQEWQEERKGDKKGKEVR